MSDETTKRRSKDSIFVKLFSEKKYVLQLYKELHPEDEDVTEEDISVETLRALIVNRLTNDLGFVVKDKYILLMEAQSTWSYNITLRLLMYLAQSYKDYVDKTGQSCHMSSRVNIPKPELYLIYSGLKTVPSEISFAQEFFNGDCPVDLKVKVFSDVNEFLYGQYIGSCRVYDELFRKHGNSLELAKEFYSVCIEKGYLSEFFMSHKEEVITMMDELFDEEYLRKQYDRAAEAKGRAEGEAKGRAKGRAEGRAEGEARGIAMAIHRLKEIGNSIKQLAEIFDMSESQIESYLAMDV